VTQESWIDIAWAIDQGDARAVLAASEHLSEPARALLNPESERLAARIIPSWRERRADPPTDEKKAQIFAMTVARLCLGEPSLEPPDPGFRHRPDPDPIIAAVVQRPPEWRERWAEHWQQWIQWFAVRSMVAAGQIKRPTAGYASWMANAMRGHGARERGPADVYLSLLSDPGLLEDEVFLIFEVGHATAKPMQRGPMGGGPSLWDQWSTALLRLEQEGRVDRQRLLDGALSAIESQPLARTVSAMATFHGKLRPTIVELAVREQRYLGLLDRRLQPALAFGIRQLARLAKAGRTDERELLERLPTVLLSAHEPVAKSAVSLLGEILGRNPALASEGLPVILAAFSHGAPAVQLAALQILDRDLARLDTPSKEYLGGMLTTFDPAVRASAERLLGRSPDAPERPHSAWSGPVPGPVEIDRSAVPRLRPEDAIVPIRSIEELLEVTAQLLEAAEDPDEIERWFDGLSRLSGDGVSDARRAALLRRTRGRFNREYEWGSIKLIVASMVSTWLDGERRGFGAISDNGPHAAATRRIRSLANRLGTSTAGPLLSAPTHRGGWIDSWILIQRIAGSELIDDDDLAQALMRIAPDQADVAREALAGMTGEVAEIVRAALGDPLEIPEITDLPASWDAVRVLRAPTPPKLGPIVIPDGLSFQAPSFPPASPITLLTAPTPAGTYPPDFASRRWLSQLWPANREPYYEWALAIPRIDHNYWMTDTTFGSALEPLLHPDEPFGPHATEVLCRALGSTPSDRLLAADVMIEAISTRRLDPERMGITIARILAEEDAVPNRWADALRHVAPIGPLHSHELQRLLETMVGNLDDHDPRMTKLVDLLRVVAQTADAQVTNPRAREWLAATTSRSKLGIAARQILAITEDGTERTAQPGQAAHDAELAQRRRWSDTSPELTERPT
jgi:hypothetical protein